MINPRDTPRANPAIPAPGRTLNATSRNFRGSVGTCACRRAISFSRDINHHLLYKSRTLDRLSANPRSSPYYELMAIVSGKSTPNFAASSYINIVIMPPGCWPLFVVAKSL